MIQVASKNVQDKFVECFTTAVHIERNIPSISRLEENQRTNHAKSKANSEVTLIPKNQNGKMILIFQWRCSSRCLRFKKLDSLIICSSKLGHISLCPAPKNTQFPGFSFINMAFFVTTQYSTC